MSPLMKPGAKRPRGHALLLLLAVMATLTALAAVVWMRLDVETRARSGDERRTQALWLARSAAEAGRPGKREVPLSNGTARVTTRMERSGAAQVVIAEAELPGWGTARVEATKDRAGQSLDWKESYTRAIKDNDL
jgi:Tfp pilus assembly protein PilX